MVDRLMINGKHAWPQDGRSKAELYGTWHNMIARCENTEHKSYKDYGGKGIRVCKRWRSSFWTFAEDMGVRPPGHTLERTNKNVGYKPGNVIWAPWVAQAANRGGPRPTYTPEVRAEILASTLSISELSTKTGVSRATIYRIRGNTMPSTPKTPVRKKPLVDPVNHPPHYNEHPSGVECIDVIEHMTLNVGNAMKYLWRAGLKDSAPTVEDLKKARWFVDREISRLEKEAKR